MKYALAILAVAVLTGCATSKRAEVSGLSQEAHAALNRLIAESPAAAELAPKAKAVLVFPAIIKGGFMFGGLFGEGALIQHGQTAGYYDITAGSYGLQAGLQSYAYAMFFMSEADLNYLNNSGGFEIGVGPTITIVDTGFAKSMTTTTIRGGVYAFFFDQTGLMAGLGLQGSKITKLNR